MAATATLLGAPSLYAPGAALASATPTPRLPTAQAPGLRPLVSPSPFSLSRPSSRLQSQGQRLQGTRLSAVRAAASTGSDSKSRFEEWDRIRGVLAKEVKSISPKEAVELVEGGKYKILDVRTEGEFKDVHPEGAVNAQKYRLIKNWTVWDNIRRAGFAFFGVFNGTEENPDFLEEAEKVVSKDDGIIVACMMGGTIKPSTNFPQGKESRSLYAAHTLIANGYKNVLHMDGGLASYFREEHPVVFKDD